MKKDCWIFLGPHTMQGYGKTTLKGKPITAHRESWILHFGLIPKGVCVLHKCDFPPCINPEHLYLGTQSENNKDAYSRNRRPRPVGELNGRSKLSARDVRKIRGLCSRGEHQVKVANKFGMSPQMISNIVTNKAWRNYETTTK